jgi:hypothetical protein
MAGGRRSGPTGSERNAHRFGRHGEARERAFLRSGVSSVCRL